MFKDYRDYIECIRNNLIQNDIQIPITDLSEYRDVFNFSLILEQVCWFYQRLLLINSEYAVKSMYLYKEEYIEKVRQSAYKEFISYLEDYRKVSAGYYLLNKLKKESEEVQELDDIDLDDEIDLFGSSDKNEDITKNIESPQTFLNFLQKSSNASSNMVQLNHLEGDSVHGLYIDEWVKPLNQPEDEHREDTETIDVKETIHGIFIDEFQLNKEVQELKNPPKDEEIEEVHGVFIDEWVKPEGKISTVDSDVGEEIHGTFIDEWEKPTSSYEEDETSEESPWGEISDEDGDSWDDSWDDILDETEETVTKPEDKQVQKVVSDVSTIAEKPVKKADRDISDSIQDITNKILTEGKMFISKSFKSN